MFGISAVYFRWVGIDRDLLWLGGSGWRWVEVYFGLVRLDRQFL